MLIRVLTLCPQVELVGRVETFSVLKASVELYLKAGLDVPCFRGCPVN